MSKRLIDIIVASAFFIVLMPLMVIIGILLSIATGPHIIFKQKRPGLSGRSFYLYKFRTMSNDKNDQGELLPDKMRLTRLGNILRKFSLDELPSFWNVIKGDMSLVGPRPLLMEYLDRYTPEQARRHEVKPGITGWAQVNGRNAISWEEKFKLDVWYVDNQSFWLDLKILCMTVWKVLKKEGISHTGHVTMEPFIGSK